MPEFILASLCCRINLHKFRIENVLFKMKKMCIFEYMLGKSLVQNMYIGRTACPVIKNYRKWVDLQYYHSLIFFFKIHV